MANTAFTTYAGNPLKAQPAGAGIILRSDNVADDGVNIEVRGIIGGTPGVMDTDLIGGTETWIDETFDSIRQVLSSGAVGSVHGYDQGTAAVGDIRVDVNPTDGATLTIGLVGHTTTYRFKNTMSAIYDVKIGATKEITASNLNAAINAGAGSGTAYYAGTPGNSLLSSVVDVDVLTLTDGIQCQRSLEWTFTESATSFSKRVPTGGADGTLLFVIPAGQTVAADALTFSTEDHLTDTLPALMTGTTSGYPMNGSACMIRIWGSNSIKWKIQASTDLINWTDTSEGVQTLTASTMTYKVLAELQEYIRFVVTENLNTTDTKLDARVIW